MSLFSVLTIFFSVASLAGCLWLFQSSPERLKGKPAIRLGVVSLSAVVAYKLVALLSILIFPIAAAGSAHIELLEGARETAACNACHVMTPMVTDLYDPNSDTLAARHFKNSYISDQQCYQCHSGYGFNGALAAKLEGYRHLVRYTTGLYEEPIKIRGHFDSASCLSCHRTTDKFQKINSHRVALERLDNKQMSCTNCHGPAHPTRSERTPHSSRYEQLMGRTNVTIDALSAPPSSRAKPQSSPAKQDL